MLVCTQSTWREKTTWISVPGPRFAHRCVFYCGSSSPDEYGCSTATGMSSRTYVCMHNKHGCWSRILFATRRLTSCLSRRNLNDSLLPSLSRSSVSGHWHGHHLLRTPRLCAPGQNPFISASSGSQGIPAMIHPMRYCFSAPRWSHRPPCCTGVAWSLWREQAGPGHGHGHGHGHGYGFTDRCSGRWAAIATAISYPNKTIPDYDAAAERTLPHIDICSRQPFNGQVSRALSYSSQVPEAPPQPNYPTGPRCLLLEICHMGKQALVVVEIVALGSTLQRRASPTWCLGGVGLFPHNINEMKRLALWKK